MDIENPIALHFIMQDELYLLNNDKSLYAGASLTEASAIQTEAVKINYLGGKKKDFLVIVHYPGHEFIAEAHFTALDNIFKRKGLAIDDAAILNLAKHDGLDFDKILALLKPQKVLFLGAATLPEAAAPLKLNQSQQLENYTALYTFSFEEMMDNNEYKKAFWEQMKTF